MMKAVILCVLLSTAAAAQATVNSWNGLAVTPPMGWRSWNAFLLEVDQDLMLAQVDALAAEVDGKPSLLSLGYDTIGIDDGWQDCVDNHFHDSNGNPVINKTRFPDMVAMNKYAHGKNVKMGWYQNNCWCNERSHGYPPHYANDANATVALGFDAVKVDGCGPAHNITMWAEAIDATGSKLVMENCGDNHDNWSPPDLSELVDCKFNLYRISTDIAPQFMSTMNNLQYQTRYQDLQTPYSKPGCWAYPDMLEVANGLTFEESKTHFAAWCVTSAPLTLGFDLTNKTMMELAYPVISNKLAIEINQAWAGHPGRLVKNSTDYFKTFAKYGAGGNHGKEIVMPKTQVWSKPLGSDAHAVLLINLDDNAAAEEISVSFAELGISGDYQATDVWSGNGNSVDKDVTVRNVASHSSVFLKLTKI